MAKFKGIVALKKEDLNTLFKNGSVTLSDGKVIEYGDDKVFVTEENVVLDMDKNQGILVNGVKLLDIIHPIGTLYTRDDPTSPAQLFGGVWEQLTADAYLKIVTANGGIVGGTSADHKIPIESMPNHSHYVQLANEYANNDSETYAPAWVHQKNITSGRYSGSAGEGQPYYPYYYGVYAWIRVE